MSNLHMMSFQVAFISYGRADSLSFAQKLNQRLVERGYDIWFDFEDIPQGVDYQKQIDAGIEQADNFIFIISPHATNSPYCRKEVELAISLNKRLIPIMHVEDISQATWQQRHPNGTEDDWEAYKAKGLHSCFTNLHPELKKINWNQVSFKEGINDFDQSFEALVSILERQRDYVRQHTMLLNGALTWERHQKQSQYLLVGEARTKAEAWLQTRFQNKQPPCIPTDLHCELITDSIKNANNLMTHVFLSHAEEDNRIEEKVRKSLMRRGLTIWSSQRDLATGVDFEVTIQQGIETADNLVYLMSPHSLKSSYCQQEVQHALSLNKRIIPLRLKKNLALEALPEKLRSLQYIDLADNTVETDYEKAENELIKILNQDHTYYAQHKMILAQALKWERQQHNDSILLRRHNLRNADAWLKVAKVRDLHPATLLHQNFIQSSLDRPEDPSLDVFISYSRADSDRVRKLNDALQAQGKTTWFDQESIASGTDFQAEIYQGIETSDNFLFVISPNSVNSPYCAGEVKYAAKLNKRFITVLHQPVAAASLHPELAKVQWIDFNNHDGDFYANFSELVRTLDTDREHVRNHTKWSQRALEWLDKKRSHDLLLRGNELAVAENWATEAEQGKKQPPITTLQKEYFQASHQAIEAGIKREKHISTLIRLLLGVVSVACVLAFFQWKRAETVQEGQINALSRYSQSLNASGQKLDALVEAVRAGQQLRKQIGRAQPATSDHVIQSLQDALANISEYNRLRHGGSVKYATFSPDGMAVVTASEDSTAKIWSLAGEELRQLNGHSAEVTMVNVSPDGTMVATSSKDNTIKLWDFESGEELKTLSGHGEWVYAVRFSPDGKMLATASRDSTVKLWSVEDGKELKTLNGHKGLVFNVDFSPDGKTIATAGRDKTAKLWTLDGELIQTLEGHDERVNAASFSPDGMVLVTASNDKTVKLWSLKNGETIAILLGHEEAVRGASFSQDGMSIVTASVDKTVKLWTSSGNLFQTLMAHSDTVYTAYFSPDGTTLATASFDQTARLWKFGLTSNNLLPHNSAGMSAIAIRSDNEQIAIAGEDSLIYVWDSVEGSLQTLAGHNGPIYDLDFSPVEPLLATASEDQTVRLWNQEGKTVALLEHDHLVRRVAFSPDGQLIATVGYADTIQLWKRTGEHLRTLKGHREFVLSVDFSPDGKTLASAGVAQTIKLWSLAGQEIQTIKGHTAAILEIHFSPDGKTLASAADDNTVRLWDLEGNELKVFEHGHTVESVNFSPDGKLVATGGRENLARIWNRDGSVLKTFEGHSDSLSAVKFTPDGVNLVTVGSDEVRLWKLNLEQIQITAEQMNLNLSGLLPVSCQWLNNYLQNSSSVSDDDRRLCAGIHSEQQE